MIRRTALILLLWILTLSSGVAQNPGDHEVWNGSRKVWAKPFDSLQNAAWTGYFIYKPGTKGRMRALLAGTNVTISQTDSTLTINSSGGGGGGETNTASNLGGGLANFDSKSGVDLRFNSFAAADFNLSSNLITIDDANWGSQAEVDLKSPLASPAFTGTVTIPSPFTLGATSVTASGVEMNYLVGVSSGVQSQLNAKEGTISSGTTSQYYRGDKSWQTLNQAAVAGLTIGDSPQFTTLGIGAANSTYGINVVGTTTNLATIRSVVTTGTDLQAAFYAYGHGTNGRGQILLSGAHTSSFNTSVSDGAARIMLIGASLAANPLKMNFLLSPGNAWLKLAVENDKSGGTVNNVQVWDALMGNIGFGVALWGTSAARVIAIGSGTAPTTSPADAVQLWSADRGATAGKAGLHWRAEDGTVGVLSDRFGFGTTTPDSTASFVGSIRATSNILSNANINADSNIRVTQKILQDDVVRPYITVGGSNTSRTFTVTIDKFNNTAGGNTRFYVHWWTSTSSYGTSSIVTGGQSVNVTTGTNEDAVSTSTVNHAFTDANGDIVITITNTNSASAATVYFHIEVQGVIYQASGAVWTGTS